MRNTAINTLGYTGTVTLSQYSGTKKVTLARIQNAGTSSLFNFLSDCLIGDFDVARLNRPTKIMLVTLEEGQVAGSVSGFIHLRSTPEKVYSPSAGIVKYSFIIPKDYLASTNKFNGICLYTDAIKESEFTNYAARCQVDLSNITISESSVLVVDWELSISNKI